MKNVLSALDASVASVTARSAQHIRRVIRNGGWRTNTSGLAPNHVQCNLVVLPAAQAEDFRTYCERNPQSCPLLHVSEPGVRALTPLGKDIDVCTDVPRYRVFRHGELMDEVDDIAAYWRDDLIPFLLGCSFSFEGALMEAGIALRHVAQGKNVAMYKTNIETTPAGRFRGPLVVLMRRLRVTDAMRAVQICARYPRVHGAPVHLAPEHEVETELLQAYAAGFRSLAIVLMHAWRHPQHEARVAALARRIGFTQVSASHEVSTLIKFVSRGDTTTLDAYLSPILRRYVEQVEGQFDSAHGRIPLLFMKSDRGLTDAASFQGKDAILSGPAGGIVGMVRSALRRRAIPLTAAVSFAHEETVMKDSVLVFRELKDEVAVVSLLRRRHAIYFEENRYGATKPLGIDLTAHDQRARLFGVYREADLVGGVRVVCRHDQPLAPMIRAMRAVVADGVAEQAGRRLPSEGAFELARVLGARRALIDAEVGRLFVCREQVGPDVVRRIMVATLAVLHLLRARLYLYSCAVALGRRYAAVTKPRWVFEASLPHHLHAPFTQQRLPPLQQGCVTHSIASAGGEGATDLRVLVQNCGTNYIPFIHWLPVYPGCALVTLSGSVVKLPEARTTEVASGTPQGSDRNADHGSAKNAAASRSRAASQRKPRREAKRVD